MSNKVIDHYTSGSDLVEAIRLGLQNAGKDINSITTADLASVDEFHIRGRKATLELAEQMYLRRDSRVLDIGSGLGGPARNLAEVYGCRVIGVDLTESFCNAANAMSEWVGLNRLVKFQQVDALMLPFEDNQFDAAMTIHVGMNIEAKDKFYAEAHRVLKPAGILAVYDVLQGEGGEVLLPAPWASDASISHLATPDEMAGFLSTAGFEILDMRDSTRESQEWYNRQAERMAKTGPPPLTYRVFLGELAGEMTKNQLRNLNEQRIRTVSLICRA